MRSEGIGEICFGSRSVEFFDTTDVQLVATAAGQLAGAVEQMYLRSQTDEGLRRQVEQLTMISRASRDLSNTLNMKSLLKLVHTEALRLSKADCGLVLLFDDNSLEEGPKKIRLSHGDEYTWQPGVLEQQAIERRVPVNFPDFVEAGHSAPHEGICSGLAVPVFHHQRMAGLIVLHSKQAGYFEKSTVEALQTLAVQAAWRWATRRSMRNNPNAASCSSASWIL